MARAFHLIINCLNHAKMRYIARQPTIILQLLRPLCPMEFKGA